MTLVVGTCHFVTQCSAEEYYRPQYGDDTVAEVQRKLFADEIKLGPPPIHDGVRERYVLNGEGRYVIEVTE